MITLKSITHAGRKRKFSVASSDNRRVKMEMKVEIKIKAYTTTVINVDVENLIHSLLRSIL